MEFLHHSHKYDVIFLDNQLTDGSGVEFMEHYKNVVTAHGGQAVPVVSMSGNAVRDQERTYSAFNMHAYLQKPIPKAMLLGLVKAIR